MFCLSDPLALLGRTLQRFFSIQFFFPRFATAASTQLSSPGQQALFLFKGQTFTKRIIVRRIKLIFGPLGLLLVAASSSEFEP
jgi:hypothetical protein